MDSVRMLFVLSAVLLACRVHAQVAPPQPQDMFTTDKWFYRTYANLGSVPLNIPKGAVGIYLDHNDIETIGTRDFTDMTALTFLGLHYNLISEIQDGAFSDLERLTELWLSNNNLRRLRDNKFSGLSSLDELLLSNNNIDMVDDHAFAGLRSLKTLNFHSNGFRELRTNMFSGMSTLETLVLTNNRIQFIQDGSFSSLSSLKKLWLDSNSLTELRYDMFIGMPDLERLAVHLNNLTSITGGIFTGLYNLRILDLDENQITSIRSDSFRGLDYLREVWLYGNRLTTLHGSTFSGMPRPLDLTLGNNPLVCDSSLCWLKQGYITWLSFEQRNLEPDCTNGINWSALDCQTIADSCDDPGRVENSKRIGNSPFEVNSKVNYMCDFCYMGSKEITCQSNGQWSDLPVCRDVECPDPGDLRHGRKLSPGPYTCSYVVGYECNDGYQLSGATLLVCRGDATWNAPKPECIPIPSSKALPVCDDNLDETRWMIIAIAAGVAGLFVAVICTASCIECNRRSRRRKR